MWEYLKCYASDILMLISVIVATISIVANNITARKEQTVRLLLDWSENLDERDSLARKYVEQLTVQQTRCLAKEEKIYFNYADKNQVELYKKIKNLLGEREVCFFKKGKYPYLSEKESSKLRWIVLRYLNRLESMLVAWECRGAVKKIINKQFAYLINSNNSKGILYVFRQESGHDGFPNIQKFIEYNSNKK